MTRSAQPSSGLLRYPRGFVLSDPAVPSPVADWASQDLAGFRLATAPGVDVVTARTASKFVTVVGRFVDTQRWLAAPDATHAALVALAQSDDAFLDLTDTWSGRYLVIYGTPAQPQLMTDATGMRSVFYAVEGPVVVASHASLAATMAGATPSPMIEVYRAAVEGQRSRGIMPMPGRSTPWTGIVHLTPNQALDVRSRELRRIFPRVTRPTLSASSAADLIGPQLVGQVEGLVRTGRPVVLSITAGVDSRTSLAASRTMHDKIGYFTYRRSRNAGNEEDVTVAQSIAGALGLRHQVLDVGPADDPPLTSLIREAAFLVHGRDVVAAYRRAFAGDTIHIRSNLGEIGRSVLRGQMDPAVAPRRGATVTAATLARVWGHGADASRPIIDAFAEWMDATRFGSVSTLDPLDLVHWEHRMACWHSNVVLESDFAFDTHVLFNSRRILETMLAVPLEDRSTGLLFRHLVSTLWPELLQWPMGKAARPASRPRPSLRRRLRALGARALGGRPG